MSQSPITVTYEITELSQQINSKIDKLNDKVTALEIGQAEIKGEIKNLDTTVSKLAADVSDLKGAQRYQIWALIGILATGVIGLLWRSFTIKP